MFGSNFTIWLNLRFTVDHVYNAMIRCTLSNNDQVSILQFHCITLGSEDAVLSFG